MAGGRKYYDMRYMLMRGLIDKERKQRKFHYLKSSAECTSRAIVSLELSEQPIKAVSQTQKLLGIGGETKKKLEDILEQKLFSQDPPKRGKFVSSAGAILLALSEEVERAVVEGHSQDRAVLVPEDKIRDRACQLCEEPFLDDVGDAGFCQAWWRMEVLIKRDLIKRRTLNKQTVYQLLPLGQEAIQAIKGHFKYSLEDEYARSAEMELSQKQSISVGRTDSSGCQDIQENFLFTTDKGNDGVILQIDHREWGGNRVGLGELCELLDKSGVVHRTCQLSTGDYSWVWRCDGTERHLPYLVERKRADDMARTLKEDRFWPQINKMLEWKREFDGRGIPGFAYYIVEGEPSKYVVKCADGCQGVGRCGYPSLAQVKCAFRDLSSISDLIVQTTDSIQDTVVTLASITADLQQRVKKGDFDHMIALELEEGNMTKNSNSDTVVSLDSDESDHSLEKDNENQPSVRLTVGRDYSVSKSPIPPHSNRTAHVYDNGRKSGSDVIGKRSRSKAEVYDSKRSISPQNNINIGDIETRQSCHTYYEDNMISSKLIKDDKNFTSNLKRKGLSDIDGKVTNISYDKVLSENQRNVPSSDNDDDADYMIKSGKQSVKQSSLPLEPLVQYHCLDTYTGLSPSKKQKSTSDTEYRPKMPSRGPKQNNVEMGNFSSVENSRLRCENKGLPLYGDRNDKEEIPVWRPKVTGKKLLNLTPNSRFVEPVTKQHSQRSRSSTGKVYMMKTRKRRSGVTTDSSDSCDSTDFPVKDKLTSVRDSRSVCRSNSHSPVVDTSTHKAINRKFTNHTQNGQDRPFKQVMNTFIDEIPSSPSGLYGNLTDCELSRFSKIDQHTQRKVPHAEDKICAESVSSTVDPLFSYGHNRPDSLKSAWSKQPVNCYKDDLTDSDSEPLPEIKCSRHDNESDGDSLPDLDWEPPKSSLTSSSSSDKDLTENKSRKSGTPFKPTSKIMKTPSRKPGNSTIIYSRNSSATITPGMQLHDSSTATKESRYTRKDRIMSENIETVQAILPHLSYSDIATSLKQHLGNVEMCVASLLEDSSQDKNLIDLT